MTTTRAKYSILDGQRFIDAVCQGDMKMVAEYCAEVPDALSRREDRSGQPDYAVLHHAVAHCRPEAVAFLLTLGADIEQQAKDGMRPLMLAARQGDAETVAILLERGADARARDSNGKTALDYLQSRHATAPQADSGLIADWLQEAYESPALGKRIRSKDGLTRLSEAFSAFKQDVAAPARAKFKQQLKP